MPGPPPKPPELRQRRNRPASRALLPAETQPITERPRLPACPNEGNWHKMAKQWWKDVWESPLKQELLRADLGALFRLVVLVDLYWKTLSLNVAKELRLLEREFGLTPLARRRLEWSVAQAEDAKDKRERRRARHATPIGGDPRGILEG